MSDRKPPAKGAGDANTPQPTLSQLFARAVSWHLEGQSVCALRLYALPRMSAQVRRQERIIRKCACDAGLGQAKGPHDGAERKSNLRVHVLGDAGFRPIPEDQSWMREIGRFLGLREESLRKYSKATGRPAGLARQRSIVVFGISQ